MMRTDMDESTIAEDTVAGIIEEVVQVNYIYILYIN